MKKIFFMAVSAVLLAAGCQKTEIQNEVIPQIGFKTHMGKLTKAENPDAGNSNRYANLNAQGFMVWGYFATEGDLNYELGELYLGNSENGLGINVTADAHDDANGVNTNWTTQDIHYWPGKNKALDFYTVSFAQTTDNKYSNVTITNDITDKAKSTLQVPFTVDASADNDLMVAPFFTQDQDDDEYVRPEFTHALTKVLVNFKKSTTAGKSKVYVISATTSSIKNQSTLTVSNNTLGKTEDGKDETFLSKNVKWGALEGSGIPYVDEYKNKTQYEGTITDLPASYKNVNPAAVELVYKESAEANKEAVTVQFASWLLIPQEDISEVILNVEYIVDGQYIKQPFKLATDAVKSWAKNTQTTYTITIAPDYITFEPEVEDWTASNTKEEPRGEFPDTNE